MELDRLKFGRIFTEKVSLIKRNYYQNLIRKNENGEREYFMV